MYSCPANTFRLIARTHPRASTAAAVVQGMLLAIFSAMMRLSPLLIQLPKCVEAIQID